MQQFKFIPLLLFLFIWSFTAPVYAQFDLEVAFPNLAFNNPVDIQHAGDGSNRLFVAELKTGRIMVFENDQNEVETAEFLDVSSRLRTSNGEEGLLGLAFHPDYENNGHFFVYYSASNPRRSVVERYTASPPSSNTADPNSRLPILEVEQPFGNHNGGQLAFGPNDGFLYIALGDGGDGGDPQEHGQDPRTLLGSILRIDVNNASEETPYTIPSDNPFVGNVDEYREEIYAYGLRNPWRFSFDPVTGWLWTGDVGQGAREEIDIIEKGGNYGWNTMEGTRCFDPSSDCPTDGLALPVWEYGRSEGRSVTGGHVYRGSRVPELVGSYIYADFETGRVWALDYDGSSEATNDILTTVDFGISSFGVSEENELFICDLGGALYRFVATTNTSVDVPEVAGLRGALSESFPNPARSHATFRYAIHETAHVTLTLYDSLGREIRSVVDQTLPVGEYQNTIQFSSTLSSGMYYYSLQIDGDVVQTRGMLVTR